MENEMKERRTKNEEPKIEYPSLRGSQPAVHRSGNEVTILTDYEISKWSLPSVWAFISASYVPPEISKHAWLPM